MDILAAVAVGPGQPFELRNLTLEAPRPDEVVVAMLARSRPPRCWATRGQGWSRRWAARSPRSRRGTG